MYSMQKYISMYNGETSASNYHNFTKWINDLISTTECHKQLKHGLLYRRNRLNSSALTMIYSSYIAQKQ